MGNSVVRQDHGGVAVLELNRPEAGNSIDLELAHALVEAVAAVAADPTARCVVLRGAGERFCVGGDVAAMAAADDRGAYVRELADVAHQAVLGLHSLEVPLVVAVQGAAAGAGLALTLVGDIVVADDSSVFLTAYAGVGLSPDCGTTWTLPRRVGPQRARRMLLESKRLSASEAMDWGLIDHVNGSGALGETAMELAKTLADSPYPATGLTARLLRGDATSFGEHLAREAAAIGRSAASATAAPLIDRFAR